MASRVVSGSEHPFGEMTELLAQAAAFPIDVAPRHEALVQHLAPGMLRHAELDVGLVHGGLCDREAIVADRNRAAGKAGPLGMSIDGASAERDHVRFGPAVRLREEQIAAAGLGRAERAKPDVVPEAGIFDPGFVTDKHLQLLACREIRRHDQDDLIERFVRGLRYPAEPGLLPLPAVIFERDDDGEHGSVGTHAGYHSST